MNKATKVSKLFIGLLAVALISFSCDQNISENQEPENANAPRIVEFERDAVLALLQNRLQLNTDDIGKFELEKAHLNADGAEDGVILINLAPKALRDMENSNNPARFQDAGYIGDYNFVFVWDGATQTIGTAFKFVGNGLIPAEVRLINLLDPGYKTLMVRYRVQNSIFQTYFQNLNGSLIPVFSYLLVDELGTDEMQVYYHALEENPSQIEKDIVIYEGLWSDYDADAAAKDKNAYPLGSIKSSGKEIYRFFFDPRSGKYATNAAIPNAD